jgi:pyrimidine operon attenuation protein/uracil phosphoribosyltransferase
MFVLYYMSQKTILSNAQINLITKRLCAQVMERHPSQNNLVVIGLQPRGTHFAKIFHQILESLSKTKIPYGELDVTFHRDDFRKHSNGLVPSITQIDFLIEGKEVILVDDVLFTGRTIRSGFDALLDYGRPESVELLVLIDRNKSRHFPIEADYVGLSVDTLASHKVKVYWDPIPEVHLITQE